MKTVFTICVIIMLCVYIAVKEREIKLVDRLADYEDREEKGEFSDWILCSEQLPEERDSIFAKWKDTNKWTSLMFEKISGTVIVTIKYNNGEKRVAPAHTVDGKWKCDVLLCNDGKIIAWMPLPEPYKGEEKDEE